VCVRVANRKRVNIFLFTQEMLRYKLLHFVLGWQSSCRWLVVKVVNWRTTKCFKLKLRQWKIELEYFKILAWRAQWNIFNLILTFPLSSSSEKFSPVFNEFNILEVTCCCWSNVVYHRGWFLLISKNTIVVKMPSGEL
jgi:hypothetical protein